MYIFLIISSTPTKFGRLIRTIENLKYNHSAISFDEDLSEVYAFARQKHSVLLTGKLVEENLSRYTLNKVNYIDSVIFKIPVTDKQYKKAKKIIQDVQYDKEYMYNFLSVLSYPVLGGLSVYKSFSCVEFVVFLLSQIGFNFSKPCCKYTPDDLYEIFKNHIIFEGNLCTVWKSTNRQSIYFDHISKEDFIQSIIALKRIFTRGFHVAKPRY